MKIEKADVLFGFDVDNTLVRPWKGYDMCYRLTSRSLYGKEFGMLRTPDGKLDWSFSKKTNSDIWRERVKQIGLDPRNEDEGAFFREFGAQASRLSYRGLTIRFRGVIALLEAVKRHSSYRPVLLSTGPRGMQEKTFRDLGMFDRFDFDRSLFYGEFDSKIDALAHMVLSLAPNKLVYAGDAASDMKALLSSEVKVPERFAVGVTAAGLSSAIDLRKAGAHYIVSRFSRRAISGLMALTCS